MHPWFRERQSLPAPAFWASIHAVLAEESSLPKGLKAADFRHAWATHPVQPVQGWVIDNPQWVEDWLHAATDYDPTAFWVKLAAQEPDVFWRQEAATAAAWAADAVGYFMGWGKVTLDTWVELAQAHPHPERVSPWLRGTWVIAAVFACGADSALVDVAATRAIIQPWVTLGIQRPHLDAAQVDLLTEHFPLAFWRELELQERPATPARRTRPRA